MGLHKRARSGVPTPSELEEAMQSVLDVKSICLDMARSTTAGCLTHSALEVPHVETTPPASQLQAPLPVDPLYQFGEGRDLMAQSAFQVADSGPRQCPQRFQPKRRR